jgi:hypothetical protein
MQATHDTAAAEHAPLAGDRKDLPVIGPGHTLSSKIGRAHV